MRLKPILTYLHYVIPVVALSPLLASASLLRPENTEVAEYSWSNNYLITLGRMFLLVEGGNRR